jgi:hypothetical protein
LVGGGYYIFYKIIKSNTKDELNDLINSAFNLLDLRLVLQDHFISSLRYSISHHFDFFDNEIMNNLIKKIFQCPISKAFEEFSCNYSNVQIQRVVPESVSNSKANEFCDSAGESVRAPQQSGQGGRSKTASLSFSSASMSEELAPMLARPERRQKVCGAKEVCVSEFAQRLNAADDVSVGFVVDVRRSPSDTL